MCVVMGHQGELEEQPISDQELCDTIRRGEAWPLATLWQRYHGMALSWARRKDPVHAEDAVADAFDAVYQSLLQGNGPTDSFGGYLYKTINTQLGRYWETGKREGTAHDEDRFDPLIVAGDEQLSEAEQRTAALAALEDLPLRWKRVILEVDVAGRPVQDVALELDMSPNSTSVLLKRAREGLKKSWLTKMHPPRGLDADCAACVADFNEIRWGRKKSKRRAEAEMHLHSCAQCSTRWKSFAEQASIIGMVSAGVLTLDKAGRRKAAIASAVAVTVTVAGAVAVVAGVMGPLGGDTVIEPKKPVSVTETPDKPSVGEAEQGTSDLRADDGEQPPADGESRGDGAADAPQPQNGESTTPGERSERNPGGGGSMGQDQVLETPFGYTEFANEAEVNVNDLDLDGDGTPGAKTNEVRTRWGSASFIKVDAEHPGKGLEGAVFRVLSSEKTAECRLDDDLTIVTADDGSEYHVHSGENGLVEVPGLWVGDDELNGGTYTNGLSQRCYVLEEIVAPKGYELPEGTAARTEMIIGQTSAETGGAPKTITNKAKPGLLSMTGSTGLWITLACGLLLVAAGGVFVTKRQRKSTT
ncbi:sigma-70 family RNA polymerase sigma factor [Leucobacter sp. UCMA 4100]|uniref:sigma-70 family RNA polymerase sigma factor n=1 Tax=Leucobacter sp. UCMA 4100 TaxID=2810534 RepID=UPI002FDBDF4E